MKKYFSKVATVLLLASIIPMASGFCLLAVFSSMVSVNIVQAASYDSMVNNNNDNCNNEQGNEAAKEPVKTVPETNRHGSLLPCCMNDSHSGILAFYQSSEISKCFPVIFGTENTALAAVSHVAIYTPPIISPSKLLAVKTTILRL